MRNLIILFSFLVVSLTGLTLFVGVIKTQPKAQLSVVHPHLYGNKESIEKIKITIFYFVPKDAINSENTDWKNITDTHIQELINFHTITFGNTSKISYEFFPDIIVGEKTTKEYESLFAEEDNDALIPVQEEITKRIFTPGESFYKKEELSKKNGVRNVYLVVFEGKGAAGNGDFALVSRSYLTDKGYKDTGSTFLAHEFYHTLGLPDNYQTSQIVYKNGQSIPVSLVTKKDIMGQVTIPLSYSYIDIESLKKMGL
jgi:hypothetical protein